jgi:hypothetical protein
MIDIKDLAWCLEEVAPGSLTLQDPYIKDHIEHTVLMHASRHYTDLNVWENGECAYLLTNLKEELVKEGIPEKVAEYAQEVADDYFEKSYDSLQFMFFHESYYNKIEQKMWGVS